VGAWIETSEPSALILNTVVAPLVGAWIETLSKYIELQAGGVAPLVGAWIETTVTLSIIWNKRLSRPSWARGLKPEKSGRKESQMCRAPRGRVD